MQPRIIKIEIGTMIRGVLVVVTAWLGILIINKLQAPLIWILVAAFLAVGFSPLVNKVQKFTWGKRGLALGALAIVMILALALVVARILPALIHQSQDIINSFPHIQSEIAHGNSPASQFIRHYNLMGTISSNKDKIVAFVVGTFGAIFAGAPGFFAAFFTTLTLMAYFIVGGPKAIEALKKSRLGDKYRAHETTIDQMAAAVSNYVIGNTLTSVFAMVASFIVMVILGIPFPLPLAFIYGLFDIIPLVGATLGGILLVAVALFHSLTSAAILLAYILVYQQLESIFIQPKVYGRALNLPNVVVFIAAILGGVLAGIIGALLAIPLAACLRVLILSYFDRHPESRTKSV
jgi:predicted PurR-regulated permease PerM